MLKPDENAVRQVFPQGGNKGQGTFRTCAPSTLLALQIKPAEALHLRTEGNVIIYKESGCKLQTVPKESAFGTQGPESLEPEPLG